MKVTCSWLKVFFRADRLDVPYDGFLWFLPRVGLVGPSMVGFLRGLVVGLFSALQMMDEGRVFVVVVVLIVEVGLWWFGDLMGWRSRGEASRLLAAFMAFGRERERGETG